MEILQIDDGKVLLSLSADDMAEYNGSRREKLRRLMFDIHEKYGCRLFCGRILIQMYESKKGGCELFVTKLDDRGGQNEMTRQTDERMMTEYRRYILREKREIYSFEEMSGLLFACKLLLKSGYGGKSEAFADKEKGRFYLVLEFGSAYPCEALGTACAGITEYYLNEHCTKIFGDHAAKILGELA